MNAEYVIWSIEDACPTCGGTITEIGLEDGSMTQECRSCGWSAWWKDRAEGSGRDVSGDPKRQDDTGSADGFAAGP